MKILYITFEAPSDFSGGGIVVKQSILSLSKHFKIDYVGPEILDEETKGKVDTLLTLKYKSGILQRGYNLIKGITTGYYDSWNTLKAKINWNDYETVVLEFSRYDFVTKEIKQKKKKLVIRVHNVEHDYYNNIRKSTKSIQGYLRYKYICNQESTCLSYADSILCLTNNDKERLKQLYNNAISSNINIIPVCVKSPAQLSERVLDNEVNIKHPYILITGSLWYGPNSDGVKWFINKVWVNLQKNNILTQQNYKLVLAGSNPSEEIKDLVGRFENIKLIENPKDMSIYFRNASIYVAPIFNGAGMKVKVAEALSYSLPVVGTSHAFIGYNISDEEHAYIANYSEEFVNSIEKYMKKNYQEKKEMRDRIYMLFMDNYSMHHSEKSFRMIIDEL